MKTPTFILPETLILGEFYISIEEYVNGLNYLNASIEIQKSKEALNLFLYLQRPRSISLKGTDLLTADKLYDELITQLLEDIIHNFTYLSETMRKCHSIKHNFQYYSYTSFALEISGLIPLQKSDKPYINKNIPGNFTIYNSPQKRLVLNASKMRFYSTPQYHNLFTLEERKNKLAQELINEHTTTDEINQLKAKIEENENGHFKLKKFYQDLLLKSWQFTVAKTGEASVEIIRWSGGLARERCIDSHTGDKRTACLLINHEQTFKIPRKTIDSLLSKLHSL